jgi:hypothetical protein
MNNIIGTVYSSKHFTFSKESQCFIGEISEVPGVLRQLWNDSYDTGFCMRSEKTGQIAYFTIEDVEHGGDGDVQYWIFSPVGSSVMCNSGLAGTKVKIFND